MEYYFFMITLIDVFVLGIMCVLTKYSEVLNQQQRRWFISSFLLIITISVLELVTIVVDQKTPMLRWVNILANYLGFGLSPAVPVLLAVALGKSRSIKYAGMIEAVYLLFLAVTFPFHIIFYVDANNHYMRGDYFWIYLAVYISGILYLLAMTLRVAARYQNKSKRSIYPIAVFLLAGTTVQVTFSHIHVTWLCVSFLSILYYVYCNGMWQQLDQLTGLLNQKCYLNQTASLSQNGTLVVFDVDDFKQINDEYGHLTGDRCLEEVAACIKKAYSKEGSCYRVGGDEFCVLLEADSDEERCFRRLINQLEIKRTKWNILPHVSVGSARFAAGDCAERVKEIADHNMYQMKKAHKADKDGDGKEL